MKYIMALMLLFLTVSGWAESEQHKTYCESLDAIANKKGVFIPGNMAIRVVIGEGRVYFHSGPSKKCIDKNTFIIHKDEVIAYREYGDYTSIMYINPKTSMEYLGWVLSSRLKETGTGIAPKQINGRYE